MIKEDSEEMVLEMNEIFNMFFIDQENKTELDIEEMEYNEVIEGITSILTLMSLPF